jgi:flagellar hook-basal body complex protein FliE
MAADITGVQAYQAAIRASQQATSASAQDETTGLDFGNLVTNAVSETASSLQHAEQMTAASAMGNAELVDVVTAVSAAELTLETVIAVRDEVVRAYQEILRMPI